MIQAFDAARILTAAEEGRAKSLGEYLDDLRPAAARVESSARFFARLDRQARRPREQKEGS